jgi:hypothetical protein
MKKNRNQRKTEICDPTEPATCNQEPATSNLQPGTCNLNPCPPPLTQIVFAIMASFWYLKQRFDGLSKGGAPHENNAAFISIAFLPVVIDRSC